MTAMESIFLIGPMGAGKTTIGKALARELGLNFHDSDKEIETRTGADIPLIFELEGEKGFRTREHAMIEELSRLDGVVLATGGGAVLDTENRANLAARGRVVYLHTTVEQQLKRTARDRHRPLLHTEDPRTRLTELLVQREPLYREIADLVIKTDGRSVTAVVKEILKKL